MWIDASSGWRTSTGHLTLRERRRLSPDEVVPIPLPTCRLLGTVVERVPREWGSPLSRCQLAPRVAAPECGNLRTSCAHAKAGEDPRGAGSAAPRSGSKRKGSRVRSMCSRTARTAPATHMAATRAYLVSRHEDFHRHRRCPHTVLVSRPDLPGSRGSWPDPSGDGLLDRPAGRSHLGGRLLYHVALAPSSTRGTTHADAERYRRLHVIAGEPTSPSTPPSSRWGPWSPSSR